MIQRNRLLLVVGITSIVGLFLYTLLQGCSEKRDQEDIKRTLQHFQPQDQQVTSPVRLVRAVGKTEGIPVPLDGQIITYPCRGDMIFYYKDSHGDHWVTIRGLDQAIYSVKTGSGKMYQIVVYRVYGDADGDMAITENDLRYIKSRQGRVSMGNTARADLNLNGIVDLGDFGIVRRLLKEQEEDARSRMDFGIYYSELKT